MKDFRNGQKCNLSSEWDTYALNTSQRAQSVATLPSAHKTSLFNWCVGGSSLPQMAAL